MFLGEGWLSYRCIEYILLTLVTSPLEKLSHPSPTPEGSRMPRSIAEGVFSHRLFEVQPHVNCSWRNAIFQSGSPLRPRCDA
jgi:hypothetical protein